MEGRFHELFALATCFHVGERLYMLLGQNIISCYSDRTGVVKDQKLLNDKM